LVNHHLLKLWQQQDPEGRKHWGLLSLMRRHRWNLTQDQQIRQMQYPMLKALQQAKQRLMHFLLLKTLTAKRARKMLPHFLALIEQFANSPAKTLAATLTSWLEPIVGMWRFSKSNGITEGSTRRWK